MRILQSLILVYCLVLSGCFEESTNLGFLTQPEPETVSPESVRVYYAYIDEDVRLGHNPTIRKTVSESQLLFKEQMVYHGNAPKTFGVVKYNNRLRINRIKLERSRSDYTTAKILFNELYRRVNRDSGNYHLVFVSLPKLRSGYDSYPNLKSCGWGYEALNGYHGMAMVHLPCIMKGQDYFTSLTSHELMEMFHTDLDNHVSRCNPDYVMCYHDPNNPERRRKITAEEARILNNHPVFQE